MSGLSVIIKMHYFKIGKKIILLEERVGILQNVHVKICINKNMLLYEYDDKVLNIYFNIFYLVLILVF